MYTKQTCNFRYISSDTINVHSSPLPRIHLTCPISSDTTYIHFSLSPQILLPCFSPHHLRYCNHDLLAHHLILLTYTSSHHFKHLLTLTSNLGHSSSHNPPPSSPCVLLTHLTHLQKTNTSCLGQWLVRLERYSRHLFWWWHLCGLYNLYSKLFNHKQNEKEYTNICGGSTHLSSDLWR